MTVLLLHFAGEARETKAERIAREGFRLVVEEPRWPTFYELAKREKPHSIIVDFSRAPSHAQETSDYLSKARDTREASLFAIHVPEDRIDVVRERVPKLQIVSEKELIARLREREHAAAAEEARRKMEAAARASSADRSRKTGARRPSRQASKTPAGASTAPTRSGAGKPAPAKPTRKRPKGRRQAVRAGKTAVPARTKRAPKSSTPPRKQSKKRRSARAEKRSSGPRIGSKRRKDRGHRKKK
jgi:hypothetical protein